MNSSLCKQTKTELSKTANTAILMHNYDSAMSIDKKVIAGEIRLVLLRAIGTAEVTTDYLSTDLAALLAEQLGR